MASFSLSNLNGSNGFRIGLNDLYDTRPLRSVSNAGDVNGDGIDDVIIGAPGVGAAGSSYVVFGSVDWTAASINPEALDGTNGFRVDGIDYADALGWSVSSAGDVNGDSVDDLIIGAPRASANGNNLAGESYLVFGSANWSAAVINLADLDGMNGFRIDGLDASDLSGWSVSSAGDVNGDGVGDIIIGGQESTNYWEDAGKSYVVFGSVGWNAEEVDVANLDGTNGFSIVGVGELSGGPHSVSSAGDFNGDGINDVIIGEPNDISRTGESYVVFGSMGWGEGSVNLSALDGSNGFRIDGTVENGSSGSSVSSAGDVNGDGIDDVIIGAPGVGAAGSSYVVFGSVDWTAASINPEALDGTNGFRVDGVEAFDQSGISVSSAGDVNGDGVDDVIIGSKFGGGAGDVLSGASYVVFGSVGWTAASVDLADLNGTNGFAIFSIEASDASGHTVSSAGDVNGDGYADLLIGTNSTIPSLAAPNGSYFYSGETYVLFGNAAPGLNAPTGSVIVSGDAAEGATLTVNASSVSDTDGLGTLHYQWQRDGVDITGATSATYILTQADVGTAIRVVVSYTDLWGVDESVTSAATTSIVNVNDEPTGDIIILGDAVEGQELSGAIVGLEDPDGVGDLSYQWRRDGANIEEANSETYVLTQADVGSQITLVIAYIDGQGTPESLSSASTSTVENVNNAPIGLVAITGTATQGEVLTAENTLDDIDGLGTVTYQWQRGSVDVAGANEATYTLGQIDVGKAITVRASYVDGFGAQETVTSQPTALIQNVNDAVSGVVVLAGVPIEGQVLTATNSLVDLDGIAHIEYQWFANGEPITDATSATYLLTQADVGKFITVVLRLTDSSGSVETVGSAATSKIENINDLPTGGVVVNGTPIEGETLTADTSSLSDEDGLGTLSYQWQRSGSDIVGATGPTYTLTQDDVGAAISVTVSYTDGGGTTESVSSDPTLEVSNSNDAPTGSVSISGTATQGETLTADPSRLSDEDGLGVFVYQWVRDGNPIEGANSETYVLTQDDVDAEIRVLVSYTDVYGADESVTSAPTNPVENVNDAPTGVVNINGTATQGEVLVALNTLDDVDGLGAVTYQWQRGGVDIAGANQASYTLGQIDVGTAITVRASYLDGFGAQEAVTSQPTTLIQNVNDGVTGVVVISGVPIEGQLLTATNSLVDLDGIAGIEYQWRANGELIPDATSVTYLLKQADVGKFITVVLRLTDSSGSVETVGSAATSKIENINDLPTGGVVVNGTPIEGETLTADTSSLSDEDGLGTLSYQWQRSGSDIVGATGPTYTLTQDDVGAAISVTVSYTDGYSAEESVTSDPTDAVVNVNDSPTGAAVILGTATEGETLTVDVSGVSDSDGIDFSTQSFQWLRGGEPISGEVSDTYTLKAEDIGSQINVTYAFLDNFSTNEAVSSEPTDIVLGAGRTFNGTSDPDEILGTLGADTINGQGSDDVLRGNGGNDIIDGGVGFDTAVYSGSQNDYTVQLSADGVTVTDRVAGRDGIDDLIDVDNLRFSDGDFNIDIRTGAADLPAEDFAAIVELFIAYFNRAPASKGLLYWADRLADGMPLPKIAESFFVQPETQNTYAEYLDENGKLNDTEAFVKAVFNNVLGRDPYGPYWINELDNNPAIAPAIFILAVLNGAKAPTGGAEDREFLANKTDIGIYFSAIKGLSDYDDTIAVMNLFDGTEESVDAAVAAMDAIYEEALDPNTGEFLMPLVGVVDDPFAIV